MDKNTFLAIDDVRSLQTGRDILDAIMKSRASAFYEKTIGLFYVQQNRLYKPATFEEWVENNLEIKSSQAYNYVRAYELLVDMSSWPLVKNLPTSEYQCRIINEFGFSKPILEVAWRGVEEELANGKRLSGKLIEQCFNEQVRIIEKEDPVTFDDVIANATSSRKQRLSNGLWWRPKGYCNWEWDLSDGDVSIPLRPINSDPENMTIFVRVQSEEELSLVKAKARITPHWLFLALMDFSYPEEVYINRPENLVLGAIIEDNDDVAQMLMLSRHESVRTFAIFHPVEPLEAGPIADWLIFQRMDINNFVALIDQVKAHPCIYIPDNCIVGRHQFIARVMQQRI